MLLKTFSSWINRLLSSIRQSLFLAKASAKRERKQTTNDFRLLFLLKIDKRTFWKPYPYPLFQQLSNAKGIKFCNRDYFITKRTMHIFNYWHFVHVHAFGFIHKNKCCKFTFKNIHCTFSEYHSKMLFDCELCIVDGRK